MTKTTRSYQKVATNTKEQLIDRVSAGQRIYSTARDLGISYSNAKMIIKQANQKGHQVSQRSKNIVMERCPVIQMGKRTARRCRSATDLASGLDLLSVQKPIVPFWYWFEEKQKRKQEAERLKNTP